MEITSVILSILLTGLLCMSAMSTFNNSVHIVNTLMLIHRRSLVYTQPDEPSPFAACEPLTFDIPIQRCQNDNITRLIYDW